MGATQGKYGPLYKDVIVKIVERETAQTRKMLRSEDDEESNLMGRSSATSNCEDIKEFPYKLEPTPERTDKNGKVIPATSGGRLRKQDWEGISQKVDGYKYNDPTFPHGPQALFIDGQRHQSHSNWKYEKDIKFYWRRASDHFRDQGCITKLFDGIDPTDIVQGKMADCYFLAALAGLAEDEEEKQHLQLGERIRNNFMITEYNEAGIYCVEFFVDGEAVEVVVDEWFPFYRDKQGVEQFCFARNKPGELRDKEGEIWVQIVEKCWAKVCGSYEASEAGTCAEAFNNIDGTPTQEFSMKQIEDNRQEAMLWDMLVEADKYRYPVTASINSTQRCNDDQIKAFGLCDFHSYTMMRCLPVRLQERGKEYRYMMQLRNPWGKKEWLGPWSDYSKTWEKYPYVHQQLRVRKDKDTMSELTTGTLSAADDGRFWMLFKDFIQFFYQVTINYTSDDFNLVSIADQVPDETWGIAQLSLPQDTRLAFMSLIQMNQKFFDPEEDGKVKNTVADKVKNCDHENQNLAEKLLTHVMEDELNQAALLDCGEGFQEEDDDGSDEVDKRKAFAQKDLDYPEVQLIVAKKGVVKQGTDLGEDDTIKKQIHEESMAYMNGEYGNKPVLTIRLDNLKAGDYFIMYRPDFQPVHQVKRLNLVFYSEFQGKRTDEEKAVIMQDHAEAESMWQNLPSKTSLITPEQAAAIERPKSRGAASQAVIPGQEQERLMTPDDVKVARHEAISNMSSKKKKSDPPKYKPGFEIELQRLDQKSFKKDLFEQMEELNHGAWIDKVRGRYHPPKWYGEGYDDNNVLQ